MNVLGLVPARGGSKGIPRKNLADLGGRPLIAWTIAAARASQALDRVVVSTDDAQIAAVARSLGAEVPFLRPADLADDRAPALAVMRHAVEALDAQGWRADTVVYLQPTSPFRTAAQIDAAVALLAAGGCDTVVSVMPVPHAFTPGSLMRDRGGLLEPLEPAAAQSFRRQDKPVLYARNGPAILALRRGAVFEARTLYAGRTKALEMSRLQSLDIDGPEDLAVAEALRPLLGR